MSGMMTQITDNIKILISPFIQMSIKNEIWTAYIKSVDNFSKPIKGKDILSCLDAFIEKLFS